MDYDQMLRDAIASGNFPIPPHGVEAIIRVIKETMNDNMVVFYQP